MTGGLHVHSMNGPTSTAIDDRTIGQLAVEPERPLLPLLNRAEAMVPLVVVLAFLPALYAVNHRTLTETGAWEGLISLRCLEAGTAAEFVDPAALDPLNPCRFHPPLTNWLTAVGMSLAGVGNDAGRLAAAYLCTAGLVVAGYILARRFGGERLGLVTAALLAFHPRILEGAQESVPQSAACFLALLALAGAVAHWQKSPTATSYQLLLGGLALGLCLLAGGPVAVAVVVILVGYIAWWTCATWLRSHWGGPREHSPFSRRPALRATAVLAATGFAVGGWHVLFQSARYGRDFWSGWWNAAGVFDSRTSTGGLWFMEGAWELNRLALPVFGMSLVGVVAIIRDLYRGEEDPARHHRGLLIVWIAVALVAWLIAGGPVNSASPVVKTWEALLAIPLVIAAGLGLIEIAERRVGFHMSLAFGLLALAGAALLAKQWVTGTIVEDELFDVSGVRLSGRDLGFLAILSAGGIVLARFAGPHDRRRRMILTGVLAAIVVVNCVWGTLAVRRTNLGDRELDEIRSGLARLPRVTQCTFVALRPPGAAETSSPSGAADPAEPPAQLVYVLGSLWPNAGMSFATSWEDAATRSNPGTKREENPVTLFAAWSPRGRVRGAAPAADLRSATPPFRFRDLEMVAYVRDRALQAATGAASDQARQRD